MKSVRDYMLEAETLLRTAIAEAARAGDYRGVDAARHAAERVSDLAAALSSEEPSAGQGPKSEGSVTATAKAARQRVARKTSHANAKPPGAYPRFRVEGNTLCKTAWSKSAKSEYEHRAPKAVYDQVVAAIATSADGRNGALSVGTVLEALAAKDVQIPAYQVYLVIAYLRDKGILLRQGREGYLVPANLHGAAVAAWESALAYATGVNG